MELYGKTDVGKVRASNQDNFILRRLDADCAYGIVCDGMGGHNGGNIASELAVRTLDSCLTAGYDGALRDRPVETLLDSAITHANGTIFSVSLKDENLKGMGTTVVMAYVLGDKLYIAHVGDSRAYLFDGQRLVQLTKDHSIVQEMIDSGRISPEQAKTHPYRHVITRVVGFTSDVDADIALYDFESTYTVLLCSDGLTNVLETEDIVKVLMRVPYDKACDELIRQANRRGGPDNITVVLVCGDKSE